MESSVKPSTAQSSQVALQAPANTERKFHQAEVSWATEKLYEEIWLPFHWSGTLAKKVVSQDFYKRHFTTYGRYQDEVIKAVRQKNLAPVDDKKSAEALNKSLDHLVEFIVKRSCGRTTVDWADNRALLFYTAKKEILDRASSDIANCTAFEEAFYKKVIHAQARLSGHAANGVDVLRDFDAVVQGISAIGFQKTRKQIEKEVSLDFGFQWDPDLLLKIPSQLSKTPNMGSPRSKEDIQANICKKAEILVNYSESKITITAVRETLGDDFFYIKNPKQFVRTLNIMQAAKAREAKLVQNVEDAAKASKEAELPWKKKAKEIEAFESKNIVKIHNSGLMDLIIGKELEKIDAEIIKLMGGDQKITEDAVKDALKNRPGLIDNIEDFTKDLNELIQLKQEAGKELSDIEKAQVKLCIRQHFTLDNPVEGSIGEFLFDKRTPSTLNPKSAEIKRYLVWHAKKEGQEILLKIIKEEKESLLAQLEQKKKQLAKDTQQTKDARQLQLDNVKQQMTQLRNDHRVNTELQKALNDFKGLLNFPETLAEADKLKQEAKALLQSASSETFDANSQDKSLRAVGLAEDKRLILQLIEEVPNAISAWIEVEEKYRAGLDLAEKTCEEKLREVEREHRISLAKIAKEHADDLEIYQKRIEACDARIRKLQGKIDRSDKFRSNPHNMHRLTPDFICDLALKLNIPKEEFKTVGDNELKNIEANLTERLKPFYYHKDNGIEQSGYGFERANIPGYLNAVGEVDRGYQVMRAGKLRLFEAWGDLTQFRKNKFSNVNFTMQDYLNDVKKGTRTTFNSFVNNSLITNLDEQLSAGQRKKNHDVAGRVNQIFELVIEKTWDEMTKALRVEQIWKNSTASRLLPLIAKVSGKDKLNEADIHLLKRACSFIPQVDLTDGQKTAIGKADFAQSQVWDKATIDAFAILLRKCHGLILENKLKLEPLAGQSIEEQIVPLLPKKKKNDDDDDEIPLLPSSKTADKNELSSSEDTTIEEF